MHLLTRINGCNAFPGSRHSRAVGLLLDEVPKREVIFFSSLKRQLQKRKNSKQNAASRLNRKVYCAQMHWACSSGQAVVADCGLWLSRDSGLQTRTNHYMTSGEADVGVQMRR